MAPMEPSYADRYSDLYTRHWWWRARERYVCDGSAKSLAGRRLKMLDIGCGDGVHLEAPRRARDGRRDRARPAPRAARFAAARRASSSRRSPGAHAHRALRPHPHARRRRAHRGRPRRARARRVDLLAPGGHLIVTVPALMMLWSEFDVVNRHFRRYRRGEIATLLRGRGSRRRERPVLLLLAGAPAARCGARSSARRATPRASS